MPAFASFRLFDRTFNKSQKSDRLSSCSDLGVVAVRKCLLLLILVCLAQGPRAALAADSVEGRCSSIELCLNIVRQCIIGARIDHKGAGPDKAELCVIDQSISKLSNVADLLLLCRLLRAVYPDVSEVEYRAVYKRVECAENLAASKLSERGDAEARDALKSLREFHKGNATFSLTLDKLLDKQERIGSR
ncbi:MAG: hypothetical protein JNN26_03225 [Candidatus Obscuribacter sp.]|nr:hypothetical protein [Candidatus Obscuribacter sp.]